MRAGTDRNIADRCIRRIHLARESRRKLTALILTLSVIVSGNIAWLLKGIGTAMADDAVCGITEHTHTEECYETVLICGYDEEADPEIHVHTDECYAQVLICGLEEHVHTDECYAASSYETPEDWEKTLPALTGVKSDDILAIASSQAGYTEVSSGDGTESYSRYGTWYGNPTGDWNSMFTCFCLFYAGITENDIPYNSGVYAWQISLEDGGFLVTEDFTLSSGDIVFLDENADGECELTGIVADITDEAITLIEGDVDGAVTTVSVPNGDSGIYGAVSFCDVAAEELSDADADTNAAGEDEYLLPEETVPAEVTFSAQTESGITVNVSTIEGAFPEDVTMIVADVSAEDVMTQSQEALGEGTEIVDLAAVDISFYSEEGAEIEPEEGYTVSVEILLPEQQVAEADSYMLVHVGDSGAESITDAAVSQNGASFTTESFSIFVVTAIGEIDVQLLHDFLLDNIFGYPSDGKDPAHIPNSPGFPYMLQKGDVVTVVGYSTSADFRFSFDVNSGSGGLSYLTEVADSRNITLDTVTGLYRQEVQYQAANPGLATLKFNNGSQDELFYICSLPDSSDGKVFDMLGDWTLIPYNTISDPYLLLSGDVIGIRSSNTTFNLIDPPQWGSVCLQAVGDPVLQDDGSYIQYYRADRGWNSYTSNIDKAMIQGVSVLAFGNEWRNIYFKVMQGSFLDHADIEIADGGEYTVASMYNENGQLKKKITTYETYVCDVNSCVLYQEDGTVCPFYTNGGVLLPDCTGYSSENYWQDTTLQPGDAQYELTSKYKKRPRTDGQPGMEYYDFSNICYYLEDVNSAEFDVVLEMRPRMETVYYWNTAINDWSIESSADVSAQPYKYINNFIFNLDKTAVVDAYNKCPNNSGLDFTVHANSAILEITADKQLINGDLTGGDFKFAIVDDKGNVVAETTNDANGNIVFDTILFTKAGTYNYTIKEIKDNNLTSIRFDDTRYTIQIEVTENYGLLEAEIYLPGHDPGDIDYTFRNEVIYTLPETGGIGTIPFIAAGAALMGGALILLFLRKQRELDL